MGTGEPAGQSGKDSSEPTQRRGAQQSRGCFWWLTVLVPTFVAMLVGFGIRQAYRASLAEWNLHSTLYVIRLVDHFVQEHGRWPESWEELEAMPYDGQYPRSVQQGNTVRQIGGPMEFDWPEQASELQGRVAIDFTATEADIIAMDVVGFQPIRPIGPYFPYWKYGVIEDLQDSLREAASAYPNQNEQHSLGTLP